MTDLPIRVLAVLGAAAFGAFGVGGLIKLVARLTLSRQKLPNWLIQFTRGLGAVVLGWLAALWLFGGGLGGFGGGGGAVGLVGGAGNGDGNAAVKAKEAEKPKATEPGPEPVEAAESLEVKVLGADAIRRLGGGKGGDPERRYRVDTGNGPRLLTLAELKDYLRTRQQSQRPLRQVNLVLYRDSPERRTAAVADLKRWIEEDLPSLTKGERIIVNIGSIEQNAPSM
jgi:hypothetical protein